MMFMRLNSWNSLFHILSGCLCEWLFTDMEIILMAILLSRDLLLLLRVTQLLINISYPANNLITQANQVELHLKTVKGAVER